MPTEEELIGDEESSDESMSAEKHSSTNNNTRNAAADGFDDVEMEDANEAESNQEPPPSAALSDAEKDNDNDKEDDQEENQGDGTKEKEPPASATTTGAKPTPQEKHPDSDPFAEEDSDEDVGSSPKKKKGSENSPEKKTSKKPKEKDDNQDALADSDDDDDDDDGDVEFDDKDAITGVSHKKGFQRKSSHDKKSAVDKMREAEEADEAQDTAEADDDDVEAKVSQQPKPPKVDPRTMAVLEPERPPPQCNMYVSKLPQVVGIQPQAFDPATYNAKAEEEEYQGFVNDMIRWRYKKDENGNMMRDDEGKLIRESNARLVQWEDGSFTLHVGKEAFEVDNVDSSRTVGQMDVLTGRVAKFAGLNGYLYLSQIATYREPNEDGDDDKETPAGTVLECIGAVAGRMTARPSSLVSEAHKSLTVAVRQKTIKRAKIAEMVTQYDPEKEKAERIKDKEALAKERSRKSGYGDGQRSRTIRRPGANKSFREDDGDYDTIGLGSLKKRTMNADDEDMDDYGDDYDDADDDEAETFNRGKRPKKRVANRKSLDSDEEDEDEEKAASGAKEADDEDDDDDDDDEVITPIKTKKRTQQTVFDDDDSD